MSPAGGLPFTVNGRLPELNEPVLLVNLTGWIDASGAAAVAMENISRAAGTTELITFDADTFIDYRARRPVMELREGVNTRIVWATPEMRVGRDEKGKDILVLTGPEPDSAWRFFARTVGDIATEMGVRKMVGLGAYPFAAPHTRPVGITATTPDRDVSARLPFVRNSLDAPAGVAAVLEHEMHGRGIEAMVFWAQIPHYVATMPYPAGSAALIEAVCAEAGLTLDTGDLPREASAQRERLDQLVRSNPEHVEMLSKMEAAYDAIRTQTAIDIASDLPSAEQLAAEVEQFLREQGPGGTS
ncbi:MAG: proteasome assembly chaperone family protein [Acidimicrobiales bacterium]